MAEERGLPGGGAVTIPTPPSPSTHPGRMVVVCVARASRCGGRDEVGSPVRQGGDPPPPGASPGARGHARRGTDQRGLRAVYAGPSISMIDRSISRGYPCRATRCGLVCGIRGHSVPMPEGRWASGAAGAPELPRLRGGRSHGARAAFDCWLTPHKKNRRMYTHPHKTQEECIPRVGSESCRSVYWFFGSF